MATPKCLVVPNCRITSNVVVTFPLPLRTPSGVRTTGKAQIPLTVLHRSHSQKRWTRTAAVLGAGVLAAAMTLGVGKASADTVDPTPIPIGSAPLGVAISPDGGRAYLTDRTGNTVSVITIEIAPTLTGAPSAGVVGQPYRHTFTVTGQPTPVTVTLTAGTLPPGLTLSEAGVLSGTPTEAGPFTFTASADNGVGTPAALAVTLTVTAASEPPATGSPGSLDIFGS